MKIGISAIHVVPGKSGSHQPYLVNLVRGLSELKTFHQVTIFATEANKGLFFVGNQRFRYVICPAILQKRLLRILFEQFILPIEAKKLKLDVLHYAGTGSSFLVRKQDVVTIHHDSITQRKSMSFLHNCYYDLVLRFNRRAGMIIAPTKAYAEQLIQHFEYGWEQMRPVYHGVSQAFPQVSKKELAETRCRWGIEKDFILTITNTRPHKNIPALIRAFDILLGNWPQKLQLVMVGYVDEEILEHIVSDEALSPKRVRANIKIIPFIPHDMLPPLYSLAKVFVFLSKVETFGMPLVEAMACGLPVVASDIPVHKEVLGNAGLMVPCDNAAAIAEAIRMVLTDQNLRHELIQSSLSRAQLFSWANTASSTLRVYEEAAQIAKSLQ